MFQFSLNCIWVFPKNKGTPKSSILIRCSIINHPFWGTPIFGSIHIFSFFCGDCYDVPCANPQQTTQIQSWLDKTQEGSVGICHRIYDTCRESMYVIFTYIYPLKSTKCRYIYIIQHDTWISWILWVFLVNLQSILMVGKVNSGECMRSVIHHCDDVTYIWSLVKTPKRKKQTKTTQPTSKWPNKQKYDYFD